MRQSGLLTTEQAATNGFGATGLARMVDQGHWVRRSNGLYDVAPGFDSVGKHAWTAVLEAGPPCALGGRAALRSLGMDVRVGRIEVWVPADRRPRTTDNARMRRDKIGRLLRASGTPPHISPLDAIIDIGERLDVDRLVGLVTDANRLGLASPADLLHAISNRRRVRRRALWEAVLSDLAGIESTLEFRYRRDVERAHGLPTGVRQVSVSKGTRSDIAYPEYRLLIELDGRRGHEEAGGVFRDMNRDNTHGEQGWTTFRYGSADVYGKACGVGRQVWTFVHDRGWDRPLLQCPRCRDSLLQQGGRHSSSTR